MKLQWFRKEKKRVEKSKRKEADDYDNNHDESGNQYKEECTSCKERIFLKKDLECSKRILYRVRNHGL
jgi:hypothetical protein